MPLFLDTSVVPLVFWYLVAAGFGLIIGSFLNVYIYRFHTGKSLAGHSHCLSCARPLHWYELFPVFSYLALRGRCSTCSSRIPVRYCIVESLTALLFVATLTVTLDVVAILLLWFTFSVLVTIFVYDSNHFVIPDSLTIATFISVTALLVYQWWLGYGTLLSLGITAAAALAGAAFFLFLWLISRGAWLGFGDVKLAVPLGLLVGPTLVFSFVVVSFWIGAVVSVALLVWQQVKWGKSHLRFMSPKLTMKSEVPFAPFLIAGALLTFFFSFNVLTIFTL